MNDIFTCKVCGGHSYNIRPNGTQNGLYCGDCGKWDKWVGKTELAEIVRTNRDIKRNGAEDSYEGYMYLKKEREHKEKLIRWQYCRDPNEINNAIINQDSNWDGLTDASQIINITWDTSQCCYTVFWTVGG